MSENTATESDFINEEQDIMNEQLQDSTCLIETGINIEDPIKSLDLNPVVSVVSGSKLSEVISLLQEKNFGCVTVIDSAKKTIGIFTERDVLKKVVNKDVDLKNSVVDDYMTPHPQTLSENDPIAYALNKMSQGSYRHIPITRNDEVKFMLSVKNIVDQIAMTYRKKILNLPPDPNQKTTEYGG